MKVAPAPTNVQDGLMAQQKYVVPATLPDADFSDIASIVSQISGTPSSFVAIVETTLQWFKAGETLKSTTLREYLPFLNAADSNSDITVITDLARDKRFKDHIFVTAGPSLVFYAGVPLIDQKGSRLGTLIITDNKPAKLDNGQLNALQALGRQIVSLMEVADIAARLKRKQSEFNMAFADLGKVAHLASHDLKSPLNNIISLAQLLKEDYVPQLDEDAQEYIEYLGTAAHHLADLVSGVLSYTKMAQVVVEPKELVQVAAMIEEVIEQLDLPEDFTVSYPKSDLNIYTSRNALKQIFSHLLHNAARNKKDGALKVDIIYNAGNGAFTCEVKDPGLTIAPEDMEKVLGLFEKLHVKTNGKESLGADLAIAKRLVEKLDGTLMVNTEVSQGSSIRFTLPE